LEKLVILEKPTTAIFQGWAGSLTFRKKFHDKEDIENGL